MKKLSDKEIELNQKIKSNLELIYASVLGVEGQAILLGKRISLEKSKDTFYDELDKLQSNFKEILELNQE